ncbi:cysteine methyltransferase [Bdellovibrio bacteriovorus]|uniref:Methylated-DNA--protein-cysteine methyltransferase n=1 Tax=Bdellovibrio bacteriovorus TaxID=959 RepID=A0A162GFM8_BDEBC|nr:methylated-DNA--[protein]-cysteine S-methyltransferase [Bdellovibrio bacteriovorus]KYG68031.1 cysteine methyltransferase [Bdellovibrio bacteriovorus]
MNSQKQYLMKSSLGPLHIVASEQGLQGIFWKKQNMPFDNLTDTKHPAVQFILKTQKQIEEYLQGERQEFDIPLDLIGTDFQKRVWSHLQKIPYGETCSYKEIAVALGDPKACRAVGTANGRNPVSIIVPCHRVIASDGTLGGYAGGLPTKSFLLNLERKK